MYVGGMCAHTGIHLHKDIDFANIFNADPVVSCFYCYSRLLFVFALTLCFQYIKIIDETKRTQQ